MTAPRFRLGALVRDVFTGYQGHITARIEHLHGTPEVKVEALRDGAIGFEWIDEARCEAVPDAPAGFAGGATP